VWGRIDQQESAVEQKGVGYSPAVEYRMKKQR
jgi:hypothetical protein